MKEPQPLTTEQTFKLLPALCMYPQVFDSDTFGRTFDIRAIWEALSTGEIDGKVIRVSTDDPPPLEMTSETLKHLSKMTDEQARMYCVGIRLDELRTVHLIDGHHRTHKLRELGYAYSFVLTISAEEAMRYALTLDQAVRMMCKAILSGDHRYDLPLRRMAERSGRSRRDVLLALADVLAGDAHATTLKDFLVSGLN